MGNLVGGVAGSAAFRGVTHIKAAAAAKDLINDPKSKGRVVIGAYDAMSGKVAVGRSGAPLSPENVSPELLSRATQAGGYGEMTKYGTRLGACAEFHSANQLAIGGSRVQSIRFTTAVRNGVSKATCGNCINVFPEAFKIQRAIKWINNALV